MEWVQRMNRTISYIEDHLTGEIKYGELAKIACCSTYHFQRMFAYMAEVPLSEYIRRRRLTLAAFELQQSGVKVVDLAAKYGYESPEAFTRAFHKMHGASPTAARQTGVTLKTYPRLSFQISVKGAAEMNYRIEEVPAFSVIGIRKTVNMKTAFAEIPQIWESAEKQGLFGRLWDERHPDPHLRGILGVCINGEFGENESFDYMLAVPSRQDSSPEQAGMTMFDFPAAAWAVFEASGPPMNLQDIWRRLYTEWVPTSSYELAYLPAIECYLPVEEGRNELWVPVVKPVPDIK